MNTSAHAKMYWYDFPEKASTVDGIHLLPSQSMVHFLAFSPGKKLVMT